MVRWRCWRDLYSNGRIKEMQINSSDELLPISCRAGKGAFWINWKGEMTPCGMMNEPKSNPFDIGFENAWKEILDETKKIFLPRECTNCKFKTICHVCPAVTYTETGEFNKKPNYICDMIRYEYEQLLDI